MNRGRSIVRLVLLAGLVAVVTVAIVRQRKINARLRTRVQSLEWAGAQAPRLREENRRLEAALVRGDAKESAEVLRAELERARQNVAALARHVEKQKREIAAGDMSSNRDPEKGMVRLEHFRDMGRATPTAAFQTAIWAAAKVDDATLAQAMALSATGRVKAQAVLEKLSAESRTRFDTPEKLVGMLFAYDFTDEEGFQIVGTTSQDDDHTILRVRRLKNGIVQPTEKKIPMLRTAMGWQLVVPDKAIDDIPGFLASASLKIRPVRKE